MHLWNVALRHEHDHGSTRLYALAEASWNPTDELYSLLAEGRLSIGRHAPYGRVELALRPEYERLDNRATQSFFRYHLDADVLGATRWLILTAGYGVRATPLPSSVRPFVEAQYNVVGSARGAIEPAALFGRAKFLTLSAGMRIFLGGEPMRMGAYGVLDPATLMHREVMMTTSATEHRH